MQIVKLRKFDIMIERLYTNDFEKITTENDYRIALSKNATNKLEMPEYYQVFSDRHGFVSNLSIVDLLFNEGPNSINNL
jgi:hypothetical protein